MAESTAARLEALRVAMAHHGLDGLLVPKSDRFQSEYLRAADERLAWLTGFTGSAAFCAILKDRAAIFVDGRYREQAQQEVNAQVFEHVWIEERSVSKWLATALSEGDVMGYDPWLHTKAGLQAITAEIKRANARLETTTENLIDALWKDRPSTPLTQIRQQMGVDPVANKISQIAATLPEGADAVVLTRPDSISWMLNVRSSDIACNPVVLCWAVLHASGQLDWIVDPSRVGADILESFGYKSQEEKLRIINPDDIETYFSGLAAEGITCICLDSAQTPLALENLIQNAGIKLTPQKDPCLLAKAVKSEAEISGMRTAHLRDVRPVVKCLAWIEAELEAGNTADEWPDEWSVGVKLQEFRSEELGYLQDSFPAIVGTAGNAAIVHYRAKQGACSPLKADQILLLDSGAHYDDAAALPPAQNGYPNQAQQSCTAMASGTTDVTRTVWLGQKTNPPEEIRIAATAVLKGHIALATARFPQGVSGAQLDSLARAPLWAQGLDYDHGTGHGVGHLLCVHENPPTFSKRANDIPLEAGMIISNEPGYYCKGAFGIRLESLLLTRADGESERGQMLAFETLTLIPFDLRLFKLENLSEDEQSWLYAYQSKAIETCSERLEDSDKSAKAWLERMRPA